MKKALVSIATVIAVLGLTISPVFAGEEEEDACLISIGLVCEICGDESAACASAAEGMAEAEEADCIEFLEAVGEIAEAADELSDEEAEAVRQAFCAELEE